MRTSNCGEGAATCVTCLAKRDPFCGWCVKNSICTEEDTCEKVLPKTSSGWLDFQNNRCPNIKGVVPDKIQITTADFLNVSLENMGDIKGRLQCSFRFADGKVVNSEPARQDPHDGTLRCATPPINRLPMIPPNESHHLATLSIVAEGMSNNTNRFDQLLFLRLQQIYNLLDMCEERISMCLESNECVAGKLTEDKCRKQHIVNGLNREGHSRRKGPQKCPHIVAPHTKLYVAAGERRNITVKFRVGSVEHEKPAVKTFDDNIICDEMQFDHYGLGLAGGTAPVEFNVVWSSSESSKKHTLDNVGGVAVEVYKCEALASNCGRCLTLDAAKYECGWCAIDNRCVRPMACLAKSPQDWLNSTQLCANPAIEEFSPKKGPVGGKTKLRITGSNLGRRYQDVSGAVIVANVHCAVIPAEYQPATEIVCETGKAAIKNSKGPIVVRLRADDANYAAVSKYDFEYVEPGVSAVKPNRGPKSGGTDVTLYGTDLDAGSEVHVSFGEVKCEVLSRKPDQLICRMGAMDSDMGVSSSKPLRLDFDGSPGRVPYQLTYEFVSNPRVSTIVPAKSIAAGGVQIDVKGEGFALLQRPRMVLINDRGVIQAGPVCEVEDDGLMVCLSPGLPSGDTGGRLHHNFAFDFDGTITESRQMEVYPNPKVDQFAETRFYRPGDNYLTINGDDLNVGAMERDIKITVGGVDCQLTALARKVLTCKPPTEKPNLEGGLQPEVVVKIGNISYNAGLLSYDSPSLTSGIVMVILGCIIAMLVCFVCLAIMYRRKTNSHQRQMKYLKTQMDTIEMKVATECKEAFAELQTSLNQYTADLPLGTPIIDVKGEGFALLQRPRMVLINDRGVIQAGPVCEVEDDGLMVCLSPGLPSGDTGGRLHHNFAFDFDGTITESRQMEVYPNPKVDQFAETRFYRPGDNYLTINGDDLNVGAMERDIKITVGGVDCQLTALARKVLTCKPPTEKPNLEGGLQPEVVVKIGNISYNAGLLSYDSPSLTSGIVMVILGCIIAMLVCFVCLAIMYRRKTNSHQRQMKYLKTQMDTIEMKVATECKEAFAELQTSLNQYTADLPLGTPIVPFLDYKDYCARVLFPNNPHNHPVLRDLEVDSQKAGAIEAGLREFHKLLMNKTFFLTMVRTMESNKYFLGKDRVYVGSLIMVVLQEKMGYCTEMLKQLLRELIDRTVEKKFQPKILFRRSESVAERMLAAWFTFLMHDYLRNFAGKRLYDLYWGIKQQMEKGPQDALTLEARYSLSEEKLLRATFEYKELTIFIAADSMTYTQPDMPVRVLDCDTITQVKEKCLDAKYRTVPYSDRPSANDLDLEWRTGINGRMVLQDIDSTSRMEPGGWKRLNTLGHYNVPNNSVLMLATRQNSLYNLSLLSERSEKSTLSLKNSPTLSRPWVGTNSSSNSKDAEGQKLYHLVKPSEHGPTENQEKMVTEIYLTRLLMMKGTLQKFINDLLEAIFSTSSRSAPLPAAIKYMFDFMDEQALEHGITDAEVVHAWKSNALPLRFWVNLIKNPHFVFDIQKPTKVEGCLSVVAQTLMDACSTQDHQLTKDSPSSKLLFAKDMYQYRDWVDSYYSDIARLAPISDQDMASLLNEESRVHRGQFHVFSALNELYKYLDQYKEPIMDALEHNEHAQASRLPGRLQDMLALMEADQSRTDYDSSTLGIGYNSNSRLMPRERM
ncbi:plexin cytoplasmic region [Ancylostoma duodenale]|uniref:Plexin cytoplasmic region n=1 Tax=Ancylostoma duodenale TaxID=51022 RepID=A0A0C2D9X4_9BILA|nr:plexin cytoplasmic region [Ancylostoma duodenale]